MFLPEDIKFFRRGIITRFIWQSFNRYLWIVISFPPLMTIYSNNEQFVTRYVNNNLLLESHWAHKKPTSCNEIFYHFVWSLISFYNNIDRKDLKDSCYCLVKKSVKVYTGADVWPDYNPLSLLRWVRKKYRKPHNKQTPYKKSQRREKQKSCTT